MHRTQSQILAEMRKEASPERQRELIAELDAARGVSAPPEAPPRLGYTNGHIEPDWSALDEGLEPGSVAQDLTTQAAVFVAEFPPDVVGENPEAIRAIEARTAELRQVHGDLASVFRNQARFMLARRQAPPKPKAAFTGTAEEASVLLFDGAIGEGDDLDPLFEEAPTFENTEMEEGQATTLEQQAPMEDPVDMFPEVPSEGGSATTPVNADVEEVVKESSLWDALGAVDEDMPPASETPPADPGGGGTIPAQPTFDDNGAGPAFPELEVADRWQQQLGDVDGNSSAGGEGASKVNDVPTPGQGVADYPQPKSAAVQAARQRRTGTAAMLTWHRTRANPPTWSKQYTEKAGGHHPGRPTDAVTPRQLRDGIWNYPNLNATVIRRADTGEWEWMLSIYSTQIAGGREASEEAAKASADSAASPLMPQAARRRQAQDFGDFGGGLDPASRLAAEGDRYEVYEPSTGHAVGTETYATKEEAYAALEAQGGMAYGVYDVRKAASLRRQAEGQTCEVCGDSITRDPEGEENRSWHHTNGEKHDHEAKPSGGEKEGRRSGPTWVATILTPRGTVEIEGTGLRRSFVSRAVGQATKAFGHPTSLISVRKQAYDPYAYDEELPAGYQDADILQREYEDESNRIYQDRARGICHHTSWVSYRNPPVYPEQEGLKPGESRCTDLCGVVFQGDDRPPPVKVGSRGERGGSRRAEAAPFYPGWPEACPTCGAQVRLLMSGDSRDPDSVDTFECRQGHTFGVPLSVLRGGAEGSRMARVGSRRGERGGNPFGRSQGRRVEAHRRQAGGGNHSISTTKGLNGRWGWRCSCGAEGGDFATESAAQADGDDHSVYMARVEGHRRQAIYDDEYLATLPGMVASWSDEDVLAELRLQRDIFNLDDFTGHSDSARRAKRRVEVLYEEARKRGLSTVGHRKQATAVCERCGRTLRATSDHGRFGWTGVSDWPVMTPCPAGPTVSGYGEPFPWCSVSQGAVTEVSASRRTAQNPFPDHETDMGQITNMSRRRTAAEQWGVFGPNSDTMVAGPFASVTEASAEAARLGLDISGSGPTAPGAYYVGTTTVDIPVDQVWDTFVEPYVAHRRTAGTTLWRVVLKDGSWYQDTQTSMRRFLEREDPANIAEGPYAFDADTGERITWTTWASRRVQADEGDARLAQVRNSKGDITVEKVQAYLPDNYRAYPGEGVIWIQGNDVAGWTLDGYVIPRLASGLIFAEEVDYEAMGLVRFEGRRRQAAETWPCAVCGREATSFVYEEGYRASGHFACDEHVSVFADRGWPMQVEKLGLGRTANISALSARRKAHRRQAAQLRPSDIPADFPVRPVDPSTYQGSPEFLAAVEEWGSREGAIDAGARPPDVVTDGECGLSWDDSIITGRTPAPSARCPFEPFHKYPEASRRTAGDIDEQHATCSTCGAAIMRYGDDGIWFDPAKSSGYGCVGGALHHPVTTARRRQADIAPQQPQQQPAPQQQAATQTFEVSVAQTDGGEALVTQQVDAASPEDAARMVGEQLAQGGTDPTGLFYAISDGATTVVIHDVSTSGPGEPADPNAAQENDNPFAKDDDGESDAPKDDDSGDSDKPEKKDDDDKDENPFAKKSRRVTALTDAEAIDDVVVELDMFYGVPEDVAREAVTRFAASPDGVQNYSSFGEAVQENTPGVVAEYLVDGGYVTGMTFDHREGSRRYVAELSTPRGDVEIEVAAPTIREAHDRAGASAAKAWGTPVRVIAVEEAH